MNRTDIAISFN